MHITCLFNIFLFLPICLPVCLHVCLPEEKKLKIGFTYSVHWEESELAWASRWDIYLRMSDVQIHWFAICNSVAIVLFLSGEG